MADTFVLHIAPKAAWHACTDDYVDPSLDDEGFIHCSTPEQLLIPANDRFAGRTDLVLLVIDTSAVPAETVFEDCYESGLDFPHIYGPIPKTAVTKTVPFPCQADGSFELPEGVS